MIRNERGAASSFTVLFTSLSVILLAFFILLNSIAVLDEKKVKAAWGSLLGSFGILPSGMNVGKDEGEWIFPSVAPMIESEGDIYMMIDRLEKYIEKDNMGDDVAIQTGARGLKIALSDKILFVSGSAELLSRSFHLLDKICVLLNMTSEPLHIEGHTDNIPINTRRFPSNWELSAARAISVLRYMAEKGGIAPNRLAAAGYGAARPLLPNNTPKDRTINRRVEIIMLAEDEEGQVNDKGKEGDI